MLPADEYREPGIYPTLKKTVETPFIEVTRTDDGYTVKITCDTKNAKIYYTIDGKEPDMAGSKSLVYKNEFKLKKACTVKAVAVRTGYKDSEVANYKILSKVTSIKKAKITLAKTKYYYDGDTKKPTGDTFTFGNNKYEVTGPSTVAFKGIKKSDTIVTIPNTVKYGGATFKVTKIADNALKSVNSKVKIYVPEKKINDYKKLFKSKGLKK